MATGYSTVIKVWSPWDKNVAAKGTLGVSLDVTPATGDKTIFEMIVNAPMATTDATLKIYKDSVAGGNIIYDGYMMLRDGDGGIKFPKGSVCTTKWIVVVSGSTDDVFAQARYK